MSLEAQALADYRTERDALREDVAELRALLRALWTGVPGDEPPELVARVEAALALKVCSCGAVYSAEGWATLPRLGIQPGVHGHSDLELRNCVRWRLSPATNRPALPVNGERNEG